MTREKIAIAIRKNVLELARKEVEEGRANSLSAYITDAVDERLRRDELQRLLDRMDAEHGEPNKPAKAWAKRVLKRARSL
jgi:antitoxin ParD1/3/4